MLDDISGFIQLVVNELGCSALVMIDLSSINILFSVVVIAADVNQLFIS